MLCVALACLYGWVPLRAADVALPPAAKTKIEFARDIEPLLSKRCFSCHGAQQQMSGLRLDQKEAALKGGKAGVDILPGKSAESRLIRLVAGLDQKFMPPMGAHLTAAEVGVLRAWIDQGLEWSARAPHWSFQKIQRPVVPTVRNRTWGRNAVDSFILARLEREGITPAPEAPKATLLRRVSLDLTGLPPTPEQEREFLGDTRPDAYERLVDRLLDSPHYGEKWARYWLDLARYADSDGYEKDRSRPWAWRYRHWVIEALNRDLPFDQFTTQQLAGDLLPNRNPDTLVATGFNRNTLTNREGGTDPEQFRDEQVLDRAATLGTVWMGLTVGCAQCHNHKYDPISQKEFYQLTAFFNTQEEANIQRRRCLANWDRTWPRGWSSTASARRCWKSTRFRRTWRITNRNCASPRFTPAPTTIGISPTARSHTPWTMRAKCSSWTPRSGVKYKRPRSWMCS